MSEPFLTATDVAQILQLHVETVYLFIAKQGLPALKIGKQWRFEESKIRAWVQAPDALASSDGHPDHCEPREPHANCPALNGYPHFVQECCAYVTTRRESPGHDASVMRKNSKGFILIMSSPELHGILMLK